MAPRQIYASTANRRDRRWRRPRRRDITWLPLSAITLAALSTQLLRLVG